MLKIFNSLSEFIISFRGKFLNGIILYYLINIGAYLFLPYFYGFEIFGDYVFYISFTIITSFIFTSKVEIFISNIEDSDKRNKLYNTHLYFILGLTFIILLILFLLNTIFNYAENLILLSLSVITVFQSFIIIFNQMWLTTAEYDKIYYLRFLPYLLILIFQIAFSLLIDKSIESIIHSYGIASTLISIYLITIMYNKGYDFILFYVFIKKTWRKLSITLPSTIINVIIQNISPTIIKTFIDSKTLGLYSVVSKVLGAPSSIVGPFIIEKFKSEVNEIFNQGKSQIHIFKYIFKNLLVLSTIIYGSSLLIQYFNLFEIIFNESFNFSIYILIFLFFFRLTVSPLTYFTFFQKRIDFELIIQLLHLIFIIIAVYILIDFINIIDALNLIQILVYSAYLIILYSKIVSEKK